MLPLLQQPGTILTPDNMIIVVSAVAAAVCNRIPAQNAQFGRLTKAASDAAIDEHNARDYSDTQDNTAIFVPWI